jgi:hypothetical protein
MIFRWLERRFLASAARDVMHAQAMVDAFIARHGPDPGPPTFTCEGCGGDLYAWNVTVPWGDDGWQWLPGTCETCPAYAAVSR